MKRIYDINSVKPSVERVINKEFGLEYSKDFTRVNGHYVTTDPRGRDGARGSYANFDRPSYQYNTNSQPTNCYGSYKNIGYGDYRYFYDTHFQRSLRTPNYVLPATETKSIFVDPMDARKPQYVRQPILVKTSDYQQYSDEMEHRESIMHSQSGAENR